MLINLIPPPLPSHHNRFTAIFPGPPGWAGARRELLDVMVQGKINRGRYTDNPAERHSIRTNQCPPPPTPTFYRLDALPVAQPTVSEHWRQKHWRQNYSRSSQSTAALITTSFQTWYQNILMLLVYWPAWISQLFYQKVQAIPLKQTR